MSLALHFAKELNQLLSSHSPARLVVAFSGGVDSAVLLDLTCRYASQYQLPVVALHVNHGLSPNANSWEQHCKSFAMKLGCTLVTKQVTVETTGKGVEEAARLARYQVFEAYLKTTDLLLLGHHQQDQLETALFRFCRGSGVAGLAGMPSSRAIGQAHLARPLLAYTKTDLLDYAELRQLLWVEDESNQSLDFSRNYLRHEILPKLESHWPQLSRQLTRSIEHCQDAVSVLDDMAKLDWQTTQIKDKAAWCKGLSTSPLSCQQLQQLSSPRRHNLIRFWLKQIGINIPRPLLLEVEVSLLAAAADAMPTIPVGSAGVLTRFQDYLVWLSEDLANWQPPAQDNSWDWVVSHSITLSDNGQLSWQKQGEGVCAEKIADRRLTIAYREQVTLDKFRVSGRQGSKSLKRWLQEYKVPPWLRERWPLLLVDGELAAIPGLFVTDRFSCDAEKLGISFQWAFPL